jgi:hypothetical protein
MKVKGMKAITKVVNEFTQTFGVTAEWGIEFEALPTDKIIHFTIIVDEDMDRVFLEDAETRFPAVHANLFLWLLMHEIGHCMTDHLWTMDDEAYFMKVKDKLDEYFDTSESVNEWYHTIGDEYMATKWAGEYMTAHPKKMKRFCRRMNKAMEIFCEKNEISP